LKKAVGGTSRKIDWHQLAGYLGMDPNRFDACIGGAASGESVDADRQEGKRLGVSSTPTFFLGRRQGDGSIHLLWRVAGAARFSVFDGAIRRALGT
jgi:protein-disulfide isomerase